MFIFFVDIAICYQITKIGKKMSSAFKKGYLHPQKPPTLWGTDNLFLNTDDVFHPIFVIWYRLLCQQK